MASHVNRTGSLPPDFFSAEMAAFPVASEPALRLNVLALDPLLGEHGTTRRLWRAAESTLLAGRAAVSLDEAVLIRDHIWFGQRWRNSDGSAISQAPPDTSVIRLNDYVRWLANELLEVHGHEAIARVCGRADEGTEPTASAARRRWMWYQLAMPSDLLLASLEHTRGRHLKLRTISHPMEVLLKETRFCETHVHLGAAMDFDLLWVATLLLLGQDAAKADLFASPGAECDEGRELGQWLVRAALFRWVLAVFLERRKIRGERMSLEAFLWSHEFTSEMASLGAGDSALLGRVLADFAGCVDGKLASPQVPFQYIADLYGHVIHTDYRWEAVTQIDRFPAGHADPIGPAVGWQSGSPFMPERWFLRASLSYCDSSTGDSLFSSVFWQIVRARGLYYRHLVMRPIAHGLQQFVRYFSRCSPSKSLITTSARVDSAWRLAGHGFGLKSMEIRATPDNSLTGVRQFIDAVAKCASPAGQTVVDSPSECFPARQDPVLPLGNEPEVEFGLVFHFSRDRGGRWKQGDVAAGELDTLTPASGERGAVTLRHRYQGYYTQQWEVARALCQTLDQDHEPDHSEGCLRWWRGIDCCTDEQGIPAWVLSPLVRWVRAAAGRAAHACLRPGLRPLHATIHAGEDFIHLLTGLRLVDEAIRAFDLGEGDRIGHGLALGIDPNKWCLSAGRLAVSREQRLFDLMWLVNFVGDSEPVWDLHVQAIKLAGNIFGEELAKPNWAEIAAFYGAFWAKSAEHDIVESKLHPLWDWRIEDHRLLRPWLEIGDRAVMWRARQPIWVFPADDLRFIVAAQNKLRQRVSSAGLSIEVNPTSNLLIGDLGDLSSHPLWRLQSPIGADQDLPPVSICIGTDDPITIASDLPTEYQRLSDAMAEIGLSEEQRRRWLSRTMRSGSESRFTMR